MLIAPVKMPAEPNPETALPTMKAVELGAAPHTADPTSKRNIPVKKTHFVGKKV
jgi:hypothetical protein